MELNLFPFTYKECFINESKEISCWYNERRSIYRILDIMNQGTNCDREMVAAFYKSGLEPWVITVSDLIERRVDVSQFHGLVFCGGFSFGVSN